MKINAEEVKSEDAITFVKGRIRTKKVASKLYLAACLVQAPFKATIEIYGATEENAKTKLKNFFAGKPYSHIP